MTDIKNILLDLGMLSWATLYTGLENNWLSREDIIQFAVDCVLHGNEDQTVLLISTGEDFTDEEFVKLLKKKIKLIVEDRELKIWRLAHLLHLEATECSEQYKIDKLQEIYADFGYPEDMADCSIYSQSKNNPIDVMGQVIQKLKTSLVSEASRVL